MLPADALQALASSGVAAMLPAMPPPKPCLQCLMRAAARAHSMAPKGSCEPSFSLSRQTEEEET